MGAASRRARWDMATGNAEFFPNQLSKVTGWLRHSQTADDLLQWTDMFGTNHATSDADHAPTAAASAGNASPIATYASAGNTAMQWPLSASINNHAGSTGFACWMRQPVSAIEFGWIIGNGTGGATGLRLAAMFNTNRSMRIRAYSTSGNGRQGVTASNTLPVAGTWFWCKHMFVASAVLAEADRIIVGINGAKQSLTFSNLGTGVSPTTSLTSVTGNFIFGNLNFGTSSSGYNGDIGRNVFALSDDLTAAEETNLMNFERPT